MNELFGVSMTVVASVAVMITAGILLLIAVLAVRNPVMFKMGLRNIPRRKAQTTLIVVGLMLSTLIMTAAFGTGDTLTGSIANEVYDTLGEADESIRWDTEKQAAAQDDQVIPLATVEQWQAQLANDPDIEALVPFVSKSLPLQDQRNHLNEAAAQIVGFRPEDAQALGGLKDRDGKPVTLNGNELAVNEELAGNIDARVGDHIVAYFNDAPVELVVKAIVRNNVLSGAFNTDARQGGAVNFATLSAIIGKGDTASGVFVSNRGGVRSGLDHADAAKAKLEQLLEGTPYKVRAAKADSVRMAELFGNLFTTFFVVLGLFSIAAGILLIFLIFVMLAAERKPEMGMARAVGAKRRHLVESFLAEGMGYDFGSAVVGLVAGIAVTFAMVGIVKSSAGDQLGFRMAVSFTPRGLLTSFCLGIIATFIVIFLSSWRASRLNIVAAIRDLPESPPVNPEAATAMGYARGVLNAFAAFGFLGFSLLLALRLPAGAPVFMLAAVVGLPGMWLGLLRGSNFGASREHRLQGERAPVWPWILGGATALLGVGVLILVGYALAMLLVRLTRDRKPSSLPLQLVVAGILVPPLGLILAAMQSRGRPIAWAAGFGTVGGVAGAIMVQWGLQSDSAFLFAGGASLIAFWVAASLRYFHVAERLSFTLVSAFLLVLWYLISGRQLEWLLGPLDGDISMFFLSGLVMVTSGVFIVVYNADVILPALAAAGSRFGRILPAIRTGVAYPLTARFRTGMTMAMIGLIMFALVVNATMNSNFAQLFLNDDTKGGFDVALNVNANNHVDDIQQAIASTGADPKAITGLGEARIAYPFEAEVENRDKKKHDGKVDDFDRYPVLGVDRGFIETTRLPLKFRAAGYSSDRAVWDALAKDPSLALLDANVTTNDQGFGPPTDNTLHLNPVQAGFEPFTLKLRDPGSGNETTVTVIGQVKEAGLTFWPGIITGKETVAKAYPDSKGQSYYLALKDGTNADAYAKTLEGGLVQVSADSMQKILDDQQQIQNGFLLVFQGFMGLGLIVGIAALGVVASRAVVERRQQIGMLRAIGYQRSMVALSFLFESGFVAISGILLGLGLGLSLAWVLFTSGSMGEEAKGAPFAVPWLQLAIVSGIAFVASMLMTFLPARAASRVPVAEALRYE